MTRPIPEALLKDIDKLEPLPVTAQALLRAVSDGDVSFAKIAELIELDQAVAANVLRLSRTAAYAGAQRQQKLIDTFAGLACLPQAGMIAASRPIGPFNSFSNEDHWIDDPTAPGVVLAGDAAGHNDPVIGQGLAIALRDARLLSEIILDGRRDHGAFRPYVEERAERLRRLRITGRLRATLHAEFGEAARQRRQRAERRMRAGQVPSPFGAMLLGPEKLPEGLPRQQHAS